jgi:DNA-directed RNA polymerase omega subunit
MEPVIVENLYIKVLMATQRAKQLQKGARPRVAAADKKHTRIAIEEVALGLISYEFAAIPEKLAATRLV